MIPQVAKRGTSFMGAGLYYLHDKRLDGETSRSTSERVDWTQTRNIMSDNPDFALRLMAATAMDKDRLKEQAGISSAGRKSKGEVYAYSIAWHPDEQGKITKADMLMAADQSLKALGAQDHQALLVAHNDADHPHVHIILNMVNPANGKNLTVSNDRKKLHKWSNDYRKERGEEKKYCPNKAKKFEAIEKRRQGEKVKYVKGENVPHQFHEAAQAANENIREPDRAEFKKLQAEIFKSETISVTVNGKIHDLNLSEFGKYQSTRQAVEKKDLYRGHMARNKAIKKDYTLEKERAKEAIKMQMKPAFAEAYRQDRNDRYYWNKRDKTLVGKLQNAIDTVKFTKGVGRGENKNFVSSLYSALSSAGYRAQTLDKRLNKQLRELRREEKRQIKSAVSMVNGLNSDRLASARNDYSMDDTRLRDRHLSENRELRKRWSYYAEKKKAAFVALRAKGRIVGKDEELLTRGEKMTAKRQFEEKREARAKRPRSRTRKRERDDE